MSRENIQTLRRGFEAVNSGDIERILAFMHPEFEAEVPGELSAEPDTYRGHDGIRRYFQSFQEVMKEIRFQPEQFWDAGERVVVAARLTAKGKRTAIAVEQRFVQVWSMRDGKASALRTYTSLSEALEAAGLKDRPSSEEHVEPEA